MHDVGRRERTNLLSTLHTELLHELLRLLDALVDGQVDVDPLALDRMRVAHDRRLGHVGVQHHRRLHLGRADAVTARVDHIVDATRDPDVAVLVAARAIAGKVVTVDGEVSRAEALVVAEHVADGRWPRPFDGEETRRGTLELVALRRDEHGLDAEEGERGAPGLLVEALGGQRRDHDPARLRLPPSVHYRAAPLADDRVVPPPRLGVDRLADGAEQTERLAAGGGDGLITDAHERADRRRRRVHLRHFVLVDCTPQPARIWIRGDAFEDELRRAVEHRAVGDVRVAGDPATVGGAEEGVVGL
mmetsp:Transcript_49907/g.129989  ORF Transcript_49907/g.129989 Transcript_49907/m.129989 type:complete len:303 (+) Transcript_49907:472-1380(+)